jgi:hypothetical protein
VRQRTQEFHITDKWCSAFESGRVAEQIRAVVAEPCQLAIAKDGKVGEYVEQACSASIGVSLFIAQVACQDATQVGCSGKVGRENGSGFRIGRPMARWLVLNAPFGTRINRSSAAAYFA